MSAISGAGALSTQRRGLPVVDESSEPASIRDGNQAAKNAYGDGDGL